jgi:hypothetical protein
LPGKTSRPFGTSGITKDAHELVAAEARNFTAGAASLFQPLGDLDQQAGSVPVNVVDRLEPVEVDQEDGALIAGIVDVRQRQGQIYIESPPVWQSGERIVTGQIIGLSFSPFAPSDLVLHFECAAEQKNDRRETADEEHRD